jgi:hypothetical protein
MMSSEHPWTLFSTTSFILLLRNSRWAFGGNIFRSFSRPQAYWITSFSMWLLDGATTRVGPRTRGFNPSPAPYKNCLGGLIFFGFFFSLTRTVARVFMARATALPSSPSLLLLLPYIPFYFRLKESPKAYLKSKRGKKSKEKSILTK